MGMEGSLMTLIRPKTAVAGPTFNEVALGEGSQLEALIDPTRS